MNQNVAFDIVDSLLDDPQPCQSLFHYTSADGLLGITETKKLWCSHIYYLNDYEENLSVWKYFFRGLANWTNVHPKADDFRKSMQSSLKHFGIFDVDIFPVDIFKNIKMSEYYLFVFLLSHIEYDLSQWRGYTSNSYGYSLQLQLNNFLANQTVFKDPTVFPNSKSGRLRKIKVSSRVYFLGTDIQKILSNTAE